MKRLAVPWDMLRLAVAVAVILATALIVQGAASVKADDTLPTKAKVTGEGAAPVIECSWQLPDMAPGDGAQDPYPDVTFEYGGDDNGRTPTPLYPCRLPEGSGSPTTSGIVGINQIDLMPNPGDLPELRRFQVWMAVDHPNGISSISDVYWDVFHPDGSLKTQVHGIKIPQADCGKLGSSVAAGTVLGNASSTGQISGPAIDDVNRGIVSLCHEGVKSIYYSEWTVSKEQPCGDYKVVANAVSSGTLAAPITNFFHVICFIHGEVDFAGLDWGNITPGLTKVLPGNLIWDDPVANAPTVRNIGNIGLQPAVRFGQVCSTTLPGAKCIDQFDVSFGRTPATLEHIDPIFAGNLAEFGDARAQVLCADELGKMDFSIHPPSTLPSDAYAGKVEIIFQSVRDICTTDQEEIVPVPPVPAPTSAALLKTN